MKKRKLAVICVIGLMGVVGTSCGKKSAETTEPTKVEQTTESSTSNSSTQSETEDQKDKIEVKTFDFSNVTESKAETGEFPYLKEIPGFKVSTDDSKETDFNRIVFYDGKTLSSLDGRFLYKQGVTEDEKSFSSYKTIKQFESACEKLGAIKIYSLSGDEYTTVLLGDSNLRNRCPEKETQYLVKNGSKETALYALKKGDKKVLFYLTLDGNYGGNYQLYILEEGKLDNN